MKYMDLVRRNIIPSLARGSKYEVIIYDSQKGFILSEERRNYLYHKHLKMVRPSPQGGFILFY